jgi:uncharacterized protein with PQ loop repeat
MIDFFVVSGYLGVVGSLILICAWASEALRSVEQHKSLIDLKFTAIYVVAIFFMLLYSIRIEDALLIFLNGTVLTLALFEILYTIHLHKRGVLRKRTLNKRKGK